MIGHELNIISWKLPKMTTTRNFSDVLVGTLEYLLTHVYHCPTLVLRKHPLRCVLWGAPVWKLSSTCLSLPYPCTQKKPLRCVLWGTPTWNSWSAWRWRCWWNPHVSVSAATLQHPGMFPLRCRWSDSRWNQTQCKNRTAHPGQRFTEHKPTHWSIPAPNKQGN